ncbi:OB-fold protein [Verrucomicrobiota bacterium sgz303538]
MNTLRVLPIVAFSLFSTIAPLNADAQAISAGEAESQKSLDQIASVQREILNRYDAALQELQSTFQKSADLEGALAVRGERQRAAKAGTLTEKDLLSEPKALRAIQTQMLSKLNELTMQIVQEAIPRLIESKKALTIAGKLDEAVAVRSAIEKLQNEYVPLTKPDPAVAVQVDTVLQTYAADRARADKIYKGNRMAVRGVLGGYRVDPADAKQYLIYLGGNSGGWVQCALSASDYRFREEKQFNGTALLITPKDNDSAVLRLQKGQNLDIRGTCDGWDEVVRLNKCEVMR